MATTIERMAIPMFSDQFQPKWNRMPSGISGKNKVMFGVTEIKVTYGRLIEELTRNKDIGDNLGEARDEQKLSSNRNGFVEHSAAQTPEQKRQDLERQGESEEELKFERSLLRHGGTLRGKVGRHLE